MSNFFQSEGDLKAQKLIQSLIRLAREQQIAQAGKTIGNKKNLSFLLGDKCSNHWQFCDRFNYITLQIGNREYIGTF